MNRYDDVELCLAVHRKLKKFGDLAKPELLDKSTFWEEFGDPVFTRKRFDRLVKCLDVLRNVDTTVKLELLRTLRVPMTSRDIDRMEQLFGLPICVDRRKRFITSWGHQAKTIPAPAPPQLPPRVEVVEDPEQEADDDVEETLRLEEASIWKYLHKIIVAEKRSFCNEMLDGYSSKRTKFKPEVLRSHFPRMKETLYKADLDGKTILELYQSLGIKISSAIEQRLELKFDAELHLRNDRRLRSFNLLHLKKRVNVVDISPERTVGKEVVHEVISPSRDFGSSNGRKLSEKVVEAKNAGEVVSSSNGRKRQPDVDRKSSEKVSQKNDVQRIVSPIRNHRPSNSRKKQPEVDKSPERAMEEECSLEVISPIPECGTSKVIDWMKQLKKPQEKNVITRKEEDFTSHREEFRPVDVHATVLLDSTVHNNELVPVSEPDFNETSKPENNLEADQVLNMLNHVYGVLRKRIAKVADLNDTEFWEQYADTTDFPGYSQKYKDFFHEKAKSELYNYQIERKVAMFLYQKLQIPISKGVCAVLQRKFEVEIELRNGKLYAWKQAEIVEKEKPSARELEKREKRKFQEQELVPRPTKIEIFDPETDSKELKRVAYTREEEKQIWEYLFQVAETSEKTLTQRNTIAFWADCIVEKQLSRSPESVREHFRHKMCCRLYTADLGRKMTLQLYKKLEITIDGSIRNILETKYGVELKIRDDIIVSYRKKNEDPGDSIVVVEAVSEESKIFKHPYSISMVQPKEVEDQVKNKATQLKQETNWNPTIESVDSFEQPLVYVGQDENSVIQDAQREAASTSTLESTRPLNNQLAKTGDDPKEESQLSNPESFKEIVMHLARSHGMKLTDADFKRFFPCVKRGDEWRLAREFVNDIRKTKTAKELAKSITDEGITIKTRKEALGRVITNSSIFTMTISLKKELIEVETYRALVAVDKEEYENMMKSVEKMFAELCK